MSELPAAMRFRNTAFVIERTRPYFDAAYESEVMGIYGRSLSGRRVSWERWSRATRGTEEITDFVRCSYLGLDNHPKLVEGAIVAIERYQSIHWSCARTRLNFGLLRDLEQQLGQLFGAHIIAFSTVMVANLGALPLIGSGYLTGGTKPVVVFDRACHASLAYHKPVLADETKVLTIPHNDVAALEDICKRERCVAYIADGVYSMGGSAPIADLRQLQERYGLFLYIDDAHGISIAGRHGEGFARSQFPQELGPRTIIAASLGKGFGASGGILMVGTKEQDELFRSYSQPHVFSAAPNLAAVGAALASAQLHETPELGILQGALKKRIDAFDRRIATPQQGTLLPIRMVPIGDEFAAIAAARWVLDHGFYTSATFFPTVARGAAGIRVCLTSTHSEQEVDELCSLLAEVMTTIAAERPVPRTPSTSRDGADPARQMAFSRNGDELTVLHTPRLLLVPMDQSHELELHRLHTDPFVVASILDGETPTIEQTREKLQLYLRDWRQEGWGFWMVYQKLDGRAKLAGRCGLRRFVGTGDIELGHCFLEEASGKGIAVEAARAIAHHMFEERGIRKLVAVIAPTNERALKAARKLGLRHIDDRWHNGKLRYYFELDRQEFLSARNRTEAVTG